MHENRPLGDGAELVWERPFAGAEGNWSIRKGDMVWSKIEGWKKHHGVNHADTHFETAENALQAWNQRNKVEPRDT